MTQSRTLYDGENRLSDYALDLGHREQYRDEKRSVIMFKREGAYVVMAWDFARGERLVHSHGDLASARKCFDGYAGAE